MYSKSASENEMLCCKPNEAEVYLFTQLSFISKDNNCIAQSKVTNFPEILRMILDEINVSTRTNILSLNRISREYSLWLLNSVVSAKRFRSNCMFYIVDFSIVTFCGLF